MKKILLIIAFLNVLTIKAQDYKFGKVTLEELAQDLHSTEPDAAAAILYREMNTKFDYNQDDGFILRTEVHERIKIYKAEGYDYATIEIGMYVGSKNEERINGLKAYTYNLVNGEINHSKLQSKNVFDEERSRTLNIKKFTMPDILDGSIIEYKYTFSSPFISNVDEYRFQEEIPVDNVKMRFLAPEYMVYRTHGKGGLPLNITNDKKDRTVRYRYESAALAQANDVERGNATLKFVENGYTVNLSNVPALKEEPFSGNLNNYMSALKFELAFTKFPNSPIRNYATSWEDVASKIFKSESFGAELERKKYFKDDVDELINGVTSPKEKAIVLYDFVKNKMNWNEYYGVYTDAGVKKAYKDGVGNVADINLMLTSMLNYAGIQASPILISTKSNGIPFFPTRSGFNYVIAGAKLDNKIVLMDAADKDGIINVLNPSLLNWKGRMVKKDGTSRLIELYPNKPAIHNSMITISFNNENTIEGNVKNRFSGHYALRERKKYNNLNEEKQLEKLDSNYEEIDVMTHSFKDMDDTYRPLSLEYDFEAEDLIDEVGGKLYITPLMHLTSQENYFKVEDRTYPVDFVYPWSDKYIVNIQVPDGYVVESLPENLAVNLAENMGSYRYGITQTGNKINIALQNSIKTPVIPATYYKDLQVYFKMILEKESEKIVLKKI